MFPKENPTIPQLIEAIFNFKINESKLLNYKIEHEFEDRSFLLSFKVNVCANGSFTEYIRHVFYPIGTTMYMQQNAGFAEPYDSDIDYSNRLVHRKKVVLDMIKWIENGKPKDL